MSEVFPHRGLSHALIGQLDDFLNRNDFPELYRSYNWRNDNHATGFRDIMRLELRLRHNAQTDGIVCDDIIVVAEWGKHTKRSQIKCLKEPALPTDELYSSDGSPLATLESNPTLPVKVLDCNTTYLGPTYLSKVLRFAMPEQYGAIDTWCVRVFGEGDSKNNKHKWMSLKVNGVDNPKTRPSIPRTKRLWPSEYGKWINILRYFAHNLPANCPHPPAFVEKGLREKGKWTCADVEMALFAYAKP